MAIEVRIPTILRPYTDGAKTVEASGATLSAVIDDLESRHAGLRERLVDEAGWGLPEALSTVSLKPAQALGLNDRGLIAPGLRADLVRVHRLGPQPAVRAVWRQGQRVC